MPGVRGRAARYSSRSKRRTASEERGSTTPTAFVNPRLAPEYGRNTMACYRRLSIVAAAPSCGPRGWFLDAVVHAGQFPFVDRLVESATATVGSSGRILVLSEDFENLLAQ